MSSSSHGQSCDSDSSSSSSRESKVGWQHGCGMLSLVLLL